MIPTLAVHDEGCRYAREDGGGHSDSAKRLSDAFNLHRLLGEQGGVIAVSLADGSTDDTVYPDRETAISHQRHNEARKAYISLNAGHMTVCQAASVLRWERQAARIAPADRDAAKGGLIVIPRLRAEDRGRQFDAMAGRNGLPIALGYARKAR